MEDRNQVNFPTQRFTSPRQVRDVDGAALATTCAAFCTAERVFSPWTRRTAAEAADGALEALAAALGVEGDAELAVRDLPECL